MGKFILKKKMTGSKLWFDSALPYGSALDTFSYPLSSKYDCTLLSFFLSNEKFLGHRTRVYAWQCAIASGTSKFCKTWSILLNWYYKAETLENSLNNINHITKYTKFSILCPTIKLTAAWIAFSSVKAKTSINFSCFIPCLFQSTFHVRLGLNRI